MRRPVWTADAPVPLVWWRADYGFGGGLWLDIMTGAVANGAGEAPTLTSLGSALALAFNGSQSMEWPAIAYGALNSSADCTAMAAVQNDSASSDSIWSLGNGGDNAQYMWCATSGVDPYVLRYRYADPTPKDVVSPTAASGSYVSMATRLSSGNMSAWIDGLSGTQLLKNPSVSGIDRGAFGALYRSTKSLYWIGILAEFVIWNSAIDAVQIGNVTDYFDARYA